MRRAHPTRVPRQADDVFVGMLCPAGGAPAVGFGTPRQEGVNRAACDTGSAQPVRAPGEPGRSAGAGMEGASGAFRGHLVLASRKRGQRCQTVGTSEPLAVPRKARFAAYEPQGVRKYPGAQSAFRGDVNLGTWGAGASSWTARAACCVWTAARTGHIPQQPRSEESSFAMTATRGAAPTSPRLRSRVIRAAPREKGDDVQTFFTSGKK